MNEGGDEPAVLVVVAVIAGVAVLLYSGILLSLLQQDEELC